MRESAKVPEKASRLSRATGTWHSRPFLTSPHSRSVMSHSASPCLALILGLPSFIPSPCPSLLPHPLTSPSSLPTNGGYLWQLMDLRRLWEGVQVSWRTHGALFCPRTASSCWRNLRQLSSCLPPYAHVELERSPTGRVKWIPVTNGNR